MKLGIKHIFFVMLVLSVFISVGLCGANSVNPVVVDGDQLSVHAEGMCLGELLMIIENRTGIQFTYDGTVGARKIFLDFKGLSLMKGIKKIIHPLSSARIYDRTGKLRKVIILGRWEGSGINESGEGGNDSHKDPKLGSSDSISLAPKASSGKPGTSQGPPFRRGPVYPDALPMDKAYSGGISPEPRKKTPRDLPVPVVGGSNHPSSEDNPTGDGSQDTKGKMPEMLPIPGGGDSGRMPIPDSEGAVRGSSPGS